MILEGGCPSSSHPTLTLGLAYLDVMTLWDHNIFLREQVLNSILRNDVLYLKGGEEAGARALLIKSSVRMVQQGGQGHHWQLQALILGRVVWKVLLLPNVGFGRGALTAEVFSSSSPGCRRSLDAVPSGHLLW